MKGVCDQDTWNIPRGTDETCDAALVEQSGSPVGRCAVKAVLAVDDGLDARRDVCRMIFSNGHGVIWILVTPPKALQNMTMTANNERSYGTVGCSLARAPMMEVQNREGLSQQMFGNCRLQLAR